jgi:hypothetical protein
MGTYLNPGKQSYQMAVNSEIFVDKTEMIRYLNSVVNTQQRYVSVSRPRRFGKTMAADMICAYYDREADSRELFANLKLSAGEGSNQKNVWDRYLGKFDVVRIVMTDFVREEIPVEDSLKRLVSRVLDELDERYPGVRFDASDFTFSFDKFYRKTNTQFVVVIDEWDAVFRVRQRDKDGQKRYLDFLRDWLKDKPYIALAYMTGILPIKKYGEHSALNMFTEYSMEAPRQLAPYTGFTENEVIALCSKYGMDYAEVSAWYDGYVISDRIAPEKRAAYRQGQYDGHKIAIYSPLSVVESMTTGQIRNYWNKTETYEALAEYIRKDFDGLKDAVALLMDGGRLPIDTSSYQNDMTTFHSRDDVLSLLIHLGYLGYDDERGEVFIPNREILDEFKTSTKSSEWVDTFRSFSISQELLKATWEQDAERVAELLEKAHDRAGNRTYNDEAALSYAIQYAYYAAQKYYTTILELDSGKGYADIVYLPAPKYPDKPALLIELKYDKTADGAIEQIKRQSYPERLEHYRGNILMIGINYDRDIPNDKPGFKHHSCVIEKA